LEKHGIGRPSTYASIMGTIKTRGYIEIKRAKIHATNVARETLLTSWTTEHPWVIDSGADKKMEELLGQGEDGKASSVDFVPQKGVPWRR